MKRKIRLLAALFCIFAIMFAVWILSRNATPGESARATQTLSSAAPHNSGAATVAAPANRSPGLVRITAGGSRPVTAAEVDDAPWKLREEWRRLDVSFLDIGNAASAGVVPAEIEFPLFDGVTVTVVNLEFRPQHRPNRGVFFGEVKGVGGHVIFSYVNNALSGAIHAHNGAGYYEIRNATPQGGDSSAIFLARLDPEKMPVCAVCAEHEKNISEEYP